MNGQYFLPATQREFVWKPEQIRPALRFDHAGYPISSFLLWELKPENRDKWQVYEFLEKAHEGGTKLSKSDLLLSMVTSNWDGVNARGEIFNFVDRVNTQLTRRNDFDKTSS